jgi:hypothetical protein
MAIGKAVPRWRSRRRRATTEAARRTDSGGWYRRPWSSSLPRFGRLAAPAGVRRAGACAPPTRPSTPSRAAPREPGRRHRRPAARAGVTNHTAGGADAVVGLRWIDVHANGGAAESGAPPRPGDQDAYPRAASGARIPVGHKSPHHARGAPSRRVGRSVRCRRRARRCVGQMPKMTSVSSSPSVSTTGPPTRITRAPSPATTAGLCAARAARSRLGGGDRDRASDRTGRRCAE